MDRSAPCRVKTAICKVGALALVEPRWFDVSISNDLAPEAPVTLADKIQIQQVLVNLMRNPLAALRSDAADQRTLCVAVRTIDDARIAMSVSDIGPALVRPVLKQMFRPFYSKPGERIGRMVW